MEIAGEARRLQLRAVHADADIDRDPAWLVEVARLEPEIVEVDLSAVENPTSSFFGSLVALTRIAEVRLRNVSVNVARRLKLMRIYMLFHVC